VQLVRDSGRVLNGAPQFVRRPEGSYSERLQGAAEPNVAIFSLPCFVADHGQICFSRGSLPRFFLHVRDPSAEQDISE
jgi:hypothetical protein